MKVVRLRKSGNQWRRMRDLSRRLDYLLYVSDWDRPEHKMRRYVNDRIIDSEDGRLRSILGPAQRLSRA